MNPDHVGGQEVDRLPKHSGFGLDPADPPAQDAQSIDHGGVGISADQGIRITDPVFFQNPLGQIFQVDLMHDSYPRRNDSELVKGLHSPLQELIAGPVAPELHLHVQTQGLGASRIVHLYGMVHHQVHRDQGFDPLGPSAHSGHRGSHGGQIDQQGDAGEVLEHDAGHHKRNFLRAGGGGLPVGQGMNVLLRDPFPVKIAEQGFQNDSEADREPGDGADPLPFQMRQRIVTSRAAVSPVEFL